MYINQNIKTKEDVIDINNGIVERLKEFYEKNNIPYYEDKGYADIAEITRVQINSEKVESGNIDTQGIYIAEYAVLSDLNIDSYIYVTDETRVDLSNSIAKEYCEAIIGEQLNFDSVIKKLNDYFDNPITHEFREKIELDDFIVEICSNSVDRVIINIDSCYDIK